MIGHTSLFLDSAQRSESSIVLRTGLWAQRTSRWAWNLLLSEVTRTTSLEGGRMVWWWRVRGVLCASAAGALGPYFTATCG